MLIRETARWLSGYEWVERRLFEVLGAWSLEAGDPDVTRVLATQAHHHAWHAQLWAERVPVLHDAEPSDVEVPASLVMLLEPVTATHGVHERLAALGRVVLPALIDRYEEHLAEASAVSDGPVIRALRLVIRDEHDDLAHVERLLARGEIPERTAGGGG